MGQVLLFAFTAAFNPTLLTATTVMLLLPSPKRLLLGYLLGAYMTSITLGMVIVFGLEGSGAVSTSENTLSPAADIALGLILIVISFVLRSDGHRRRAEERKAKKAKEPQKTPKWQAALSKGSARDTFVVGALLTLPGASYLAGLNQIHDQELSTTMTVLCIIGFNLIMLALLEIPLIGYTFAPESTQQTVERVRQALNRNGGRILYIGAAVMGVLLVARGVIELL
jgi:Sap, sulfolipid-1-addressing protein